MFQWTWLEQAIERSIIPKRADQYNSIHERLIEAWKKLGGGHHLHLAGHDWKAPRIPAPSPISRTPRGRRALRPRCSTSRTIGWRDDGRFVDLDNRAIELAFKLYPWEWMFHDAFGASSPRLRRAGSSRPGRRSSPTRASCRCCGRCFPDTRICCRPISRTIRKPPSSARPSCASRCSRAKAPMSRWSRAASTLVEQDRALWRRRFHSPGAVRRCRIFPDSIR